MSHTCHAKGCNIEVPPRMFMHRNHWFMLPKAMRDRLWELYVEGQEIRKDPSPEYLAHATACIAYVARKEQL